METMTSSIFKYTPTISDYDYVLTSTNTCDNRQPYLATNSADKVRGPLISVITVVLNGKDILEKTIDSVLKQTYGNIEYIIVDGGSRDETIEIIKRYDSSISCWLSERDVGIADAMNKGIALCRGEITSFLNAGDYYVDCAVLEDIAKWYSDASWSWACGRACLLLDYRETRFRQKPIKYRKWKNYYMTPHCHQATFIKRSCFEQLGLYAIGNDRLFDIDFFLRVANQELPMVTDRFIAWYDISGLSATIRFKSIFDRISLTFNYCPLLTRPLWVVMICVRWLKSLAGFFVKKIIRHWM